MGFRTTDKNAHDARTCGSPAAAGRPLCRRYVSIVVRPKNSFSALLLFLCWSFGALAQLSKSKPRRRGPTLTSEPWRASRHQCRVAVAHAEKGTMGSGRVHASRRWKSDYPG